MAQREGVAMSGFEEHLRGVRTRAGLSQPELAEKVGVDKSYISKLERGVESPPSRKVAVKLADSLGMTNRPVTLYVSPKDIAALERFTFLLEAKVAGAEDVKGIRLVEVEDDGALESDQQASGTPILTLAHPALNLSHSLLDAIWEQIEARIEPAHLSDEQIKRLGAAFIGITPYLLELIKTEPER
jgi:transcriptional regulator with XRE-family HTH domain